VYLSQIWVYPVKSLRGYSVTSESLTDGGLARDRRWMIVDKSGRFLTQRQLPTMVHLFARVEADQSLMITHRDGESLTVHPRSMSGRTITAQIWSDACPVIPAPDEIN
jgi:hypothetical protein